MSARDAGLVVLARVPEKGRVKTRLQECFSQEQTLAIYEAMLRDVVELAAGLREQFAEVAVYWEGTPTENRLQKLGPGCSLLAHYSQRGENLGMRMFHALEEAFARGNKKVLLIGCDSPTLPASYLLKALEYLESADVVLGPSEDGGYYLIGSTTPVKKPFEAVSWGTAEVLSQSLNLLKGLGLRVALLPSWYDLDRPEDLRRLMLDLDPGIAQNLKALLRRLTAETQRRREET